MIVQIETCNSYGSRGCCKQETWISNLNIEEQRVPSVVLIVFLISQHQLAESWLKDRLDVVHLRDMLHG